MKINKVFIVNNVTNFIIIRESSSYSSSKKPIKGVSAGQRYSYYSKRGHNSYTYKVEIEDAEDSDMSK